MMASDVGTPLSPERNLKLARQTLEIGSNATVTTGGREAATTAEASTETSSIAIAGSNNVGADAIGAEAVGDDAVGADAGTATKESGPLPAFPRLPYRPVKTLSNRPRMCSRTQVWGAIGSFAKVFLLMCKLPQY